MLLNSNARTDAALVRQLWSSRKPVMRWVIKNSGTKEDAEDVVQEAIVAYLNMQCKPGFIAWAKPETILFAIGKKIWLFQLRKNARMPLDSMLDEHFSAEMETMEPLLEKEMQYRSLENALKDMGQTCRQLLDMFYFMKMDMKSIAEKLGFRNDKVAKAMKYKCLEQARQLIRNKHEGH